MEKGKLHMDPMIGRLFFNKYRLIKNIGGGSFGQIYSAKYKNNWFALKFEQKNQNQNLLENEGHIMSYLQSKYLPYIYSFGQSGEFNVLVMELMGKSLENIFENSNPKKFSVNCVAKLGLQMIEILRFIHNKNIIHRDIKPDNFVVGKNDKNKNLYILDFGLAKKYRSSKTLEHYPMIKHKNLTGTARYASINALNGLSQSRRDDLEAVGYVLLYFLRGKLPWQGIRLKKKEERYNRIMEKKIETTPEELCKDFPQEFELYIKYCRGLEYTEDPDYIYLMKLFNNVLKGYSENIYDWDIINKTAITATTSSTSKKQLNFDEKKDNYKKNYHKKLSEQINYNVYNNQNFQILETKDLMLNTNRNKNENINNTFIDIKDFSGYMDEFTEEESIKNKNKYPNVFGKIQNKETLDKNFEINKKNNNDYCIII